jgi:membrane-associated phospholipid phosphatase
MLEQRLISNSVAKGNLWRPFAISVWRTPPCTRLITPVAWAALALFVTVDLIWFILSPMVFAPANFRLVGQSILLFGGLSAMPKLVVFRLTGDSSPISKFILSISDKVARFLRAIVFTLGFGFAGCIFTYLAASLGWPLQDAQLAAVDSSMGFNWLDLLISANSSPLFGAVLKAAYHSSATQIVGVCLLLAATNRDKRLAEFLTLFSVTFVVVGAISALVPAAGPYAYFQPPKTFFTSFSTDAGMWHYQVLQTLRNEPVPVLSLMNVQGLVTFPSFHTCLAIITAYAVRGIRFVALPVAILNGLVIVSTLPEGGHYLIDVIAGAIISVIAIIAARTRDRPRSIVPKLQN